jgi:hypothetical protein
LALGFGTTSVLEPKAQSLEPEARKARVRKGRARE